MLVFDHLCFQVSKPEKQENFEKPNFLLDDLGIKSLKIVVLEFGFLKLFAVLDLQ